MEYINNFFYFFNEYDAKSITEEGKKNIRKLINKYKQQKTESHGKNERS